MFSRAPGLVIENLSVIVRSGIFRRDAILDNLSFTIRPGELAYLIGDNGAGKTTLFNCLSGVKNAYAGTIYVDGINLRDINNENLKITYLQQGWLFRHFQVTRGFCCDNADGTEFCGLDEVIIHLLKTVRNKVRKWLTPSSPKPVTSIFLYDELNQGRLLERTIYDPRRAGGGVHIESIQEALLEIRLNCKKIPGVGIFSAHPRSKEELDFYVQTANHILCLEKGKLVEGEAYLTQLYQSTQKY